MLLSYLPLILDLEPKLMFFKFDTSRIEVESENCVRAAITDLEAVLVMSGEAFVRTESSRIDPTNELKT